VSKNLFNFRDPRSKKWYDFDDSCVDELKSPEDAIT